MLSDNCNKFNEMNCDKLTEDVGINYLSQKNGDGFMLLN